MIVIDASVLANAVADDGDDGATARRQLAHDDDVVAPDLVDVETLSVLRRRWLAGDLTAERCAAALDDLALLPVRRYPTLPLLRRAFELRANLSAYDACYVSLAEALECALVTADTRVAGAPGVRCALTVLAPAMP